MTMNLLKQIAASRLPASFYRKEDIDGIRILRAAGLIIAFDPAPAEPLTLSGSASAVQVLAITEKGRQELARFQLPEPKAVPRRHNMPRVFGFPGTQNGTSQRQSGQPGRMQ